MLILILSSLDPSHNFSRILYDYLSRYEHCSQFDHAGSCKMIEQENEQLELAHQNLMRMHRLRT